MMEQSPHTSSTISSLNQARIAQELYRHQKLSRAQIAQFLQLTAPAISKLTSRMIDMDLIQETGDMPGLGRRRSIGLQLKTTSYRVLGVKFARTRIQIGVFDLTGHPIQQKELPPVQDNLIAQAIQETKNYIEQTLEHDPKIIAIGIAVPGPYLRNEGTIALVTSMQGWCGVNFKTTFENAFCVPTFIEQDARAGALAQYLFAADKSSENSAYYLVGEGVGLGVLEKGRILNGERGGATELGHISIDINGRECECGNRGCLERYCSAVAVHQRLQTLPQFTKHFPEIRGLNHTAACLLLFSEASQGQDKAIELVQEIGTYVGYGCVTIINAFNPRTIIIGDIMAAAGDLLLTAVQKVVKERAIPELNDQTTISLSNLPADATLMGAAAIAVSHFLENPSYFAQLQKQRKIRPSPVRDTNTLIEQKQA